MIRSSRQLLTKAFKGCGCLTRQTPLTVTPAKEITAVPAPLTSTVAGGDHTTAGATPVRLSPMSIPAISPVRAPQVTIPERRFSTDSSKSQKSFVVNDSAEFDSKVRNAQEPVLIDFHATWCGPCKHVEPLIKKAVEEHGGGVVKLAKVDVDELEDEAEEFRIELLPSIIGFYKGKKMFNLTGIRSNEEYEAAINQLKEAHKQE